MRSLASLPLLAMLSLVAVSGLCAQNTPAPAPRHGFYGSAGAGYGSARAGVDLNGTVTWETRSAITYYAAAGYTLTPRLRVGGEVSYFQVDNAIPSAFGPNVWATAIFWSAAVAYYPIAHRDLWVKLDLGYANLIGARSGLSATEGGFGGGIGVGYDWPIGHSPLVIIPFMNYFAQFAPGEFGGVLQGTGDTGKIALFQVGVGFGYRH